MLITRYKFRGMLVATLAATLSAQVVLAQDLGPKVITNKAVRSEHMSAHSEQDTTYNSPADRANDALLITEVKSALAHDGVANGYPITVGASHGVVMLTGVLGSHEDVAHAISLAQNAEGVKDVQSSLTVEKRAGE
jgi:osmotically-inducible protein OsmY